MICTIPAKKNDAEGQQATETALDDLVASLKQAGLRVKVDDRDYVRIGAKIFEWERKGVPLRIEVGPRDVKEQVCVFKYRAGSGAESKATVELASAAETAQSGLEQLQQELFQTAKKRLENGITTGATYEEMKAALEADEASVYDGPGLYLVPWKCDAENEDKIKEDCKATIRCYPMDANEVVLLL